MKYDFETSPIMPGRGNTHYIRWQEEIKAKGIESYRGSFMHFPIAPQITEAFIQRSKGTFGYTEADDEYFSAVLNWMKKRRGWNVSKEALCPYYGTMQAIATAFRAFSNEGDGVILPAPGYFLNGFIDRNRRKQVAVPLKVENESYRLDLPLMQRAMTKKENKILLICNPNNPTGTVWQKEELMQLIQFAYEHKVLIISDEIFAELTFPGFTTVPFVACGEDSQAPVITITSIGKAFNLPGQPHSNVFIEHPEIRQRFLAQARYEMVRDMDAFIYTAVVTAYTQCADWLDEVRAIMVKHYRLWSEFLQTHIPQVVIVPPQGTYLLWIDWRELGLNDDELQSFLYGEACIAIDRGDKFGPGGEGFTRTNIAMPTRDLEAMLARLYEAARNRGYAD